MRILLISANKEKNPYPVAPIGLAYVASHLIKNGHTVEILDLCFVDDAYVEPSQTINWFAPDIIGISIRNVDNLTYPKSVFYLPEIKPLFDKLKDLDTPLVVGGPGFSLFPEAILRYFDVKFGIIGEGEYAFAEFANRYEKCSDVYNIPNLVYLKDNKFYQNPVTLAGSFYQPARKLLDDKRYFELGGMANIQTKRGCPFKCIYCTYPHLDGEGIRCRDEKDIVYEVERLKNESGIDYIFFVDDIFNHPIEHAKGICMEIIKRGLEINWTCFATPRGMTYELVKLMERAGCKGVEFGTDAGSTVTMEKFRKSFTLDDVRKVSKLCDKAGLESAHYLILGGPGETEETLEETFSFMDEINPGAVIAMIGVRIYPNTGLERMSVREGIIKKGEDILSPRFYISPFISKERLLEKVRNHAVRQPNWIVPGLDIKSSEETMTALRRFGYHGPLWNILGKKNRQVCKGG